MGRAAFELGTVVVMDAASLRILRKVSDSIWQFEDVKTKRLVELEEKAIQRKYANGTISIPGTGAIANCGPANSHLSEADFERAKIRLAYVMAVLDLPISREPFENAISEVWKRLQRPDRQPSFTRVYAWMRRDVRSLIDNNSAKGNRTSRYTSRVLELCNRAIESKYMTRGRGSIQDVVDDAIIRVMEANKLEPAGLALQLPTRRLIKRLITAIPAIDKDAARYGRDFARRKFRSVKGHIVSNAPLERAEIDHTHLDLFVVDERNHLPLGRPYVTACIDHYSRCILGIDIGFDPPSFLIVAKCLKDCFRPKVHLAEEYPEITCEWPAFGVMRELVLDNGQEFHSISLDQVCFSLGIQMTFSPRRQPWFKPIIERFFGSLNRATAHGIPGTTFSSIVEKNDYDPARHAVVTLAELRKRIRKWIADVYHQQPHGSLGMSPAQMWNSSISFQDIPVPDASTQLDAIMGRIYQRAN
jgi:putative transposase